MGVQLLAKYVIFGKVQGKHVGMDQYLLIPFLVGYSHPFTSYFDVNYRGTIGFDTLPFGPCGYKRHDVPWLAQRHGSSAVGSQNPS